MLWLSIPKAEKAAVWGLKKKSLSVFHGHFAFISLKSLGCCSSVCGCCPPISRLLYTSDLISGGRLVAKSSGMATIFTIWKPYGSVFEETPVLVVPLKSLLWGEGASLLSRWNTYTQPSSRSILGVALSFVSAAGGSASSSCSNEASDWSCLVIKRPEHFVSRRVGSRDPAPLTTSTSSDTLWWAMRRGRRAPLWASLAGKSLFLTLPPHFELTVSFNEKGNS